MNNLIKGSDLKIIIIGAEFNSIPMRKDFTFSKNKVAINAILTRDNIIKYFDFIDNIYTLQVYDKEILLFSKELKFSKFTVHAKLNDVVNGYFLFTNI